MEYKVIGKRVKRVEDPRLLTGGALFVGDVNLPNMLHAAFVRSDYAHARIKSIDTSAAKEIPGVVGVYTAEDMGYAWEPGEGGASCGTRCGGRARRRFPGGSARVAASSNPFS